MQAITTIGIGIAKSVFQIQGRSASTLHESANGNVRVYFPIVTSFVLSVVLPLILRFFS